MKGLNCIAVLKALSELTRMRMLRFLLQEPRSVNEVAAALGISHYNASKHLRILREAGLLGIERRGKQRFYGLAADLRRHLQKNKSVLRLKCCTFRFDQLPK